MEPLQTYEIPLLHPIAVHFPIVLLTIGTVAVLFWAARPSAFWYRCAALAYLAGSLGTIAAYFTGEAAEDAAEDVPIVEEIVDLHEEMAIWTLAAALVTLLAIVLANPRMLSGSDEQTHPKLPVRAAISLLAIISAVLVAWTSHLGGLMVWGVPR
jgi:uncharacterized membrane protein